MKIIFGLTGWAKRSAAASLLLLMTSTGAVSAAVVWDYSPSTTGSGGVPANQGYWSNNAPGQNFLEKFSFRQAMLLTGMDIYSGHEYGSIGQSATIRLFSDLSGGPGSMITQFAENINAVDSVGSVGNETRKHVDFSSSLTLLASTFYWIGMSGTSQELAQMGLQSNPPGDGGMWLLNGATPTGFNGSVGDMAFRLEGAPVPEPSTYLAGALLLLPFGLQGIRHFRSRKQAA